MKGSRRFTLALAGLLATVAAAAPPGNEDLGGPAPSGDVLQFLDGSGIHGKLEGMDPESGVRWRHPAATDPIEFSPRNLARVRFDHTLAPSEVSKPTCRFRFTNGDEVFGDLTAMEEEIVRLKTWFGGSLEAPVESLQSLTFYPEGYVVLYQGPVNDEGWRFGRGSSRWEFRDGAFVTDGVGALGRDFNLPGSVSFEFDLSWTGQFSLVLSLFTDVLDRFDYASSSYVFYFGMGQVSLQRIQAGAGISNMGQVEIPVMKTKNSAHFEIRASREEAVLALLVDGVLLQRWKDNAGFTAKGKGAVFFSQMAGTTLKLSQMRVTEWDGKFERDRLVAPGGSDDVVHLANRDKVVGKVQSIREGVLTIHTEQLPLEIPLPRVTQVYLGTTVTNLASSSPWLVRAFLNSGGAVSFQLEKWSEQEVSGRSPNFGPLVFNPLSFRQMEFNLDRLADAAQNKESDPEEIWNLP